MATVSRGERQNAFFSAALDILLPVHPSASFPFSFQKHLIPFITRVVCQRRVVRTVF